MWKFVVVLLCLLVASSTQNDQQCPSLRADNSCQCIDAFAKIFLKCRQTTDTELNEFLQLMKGYNVTELHIENSTLRYVPSKLLKDINVYRIHVLDSMMYYLFDRPLSGAIANTLMYLKLTNVDFELGLDWNLFEETDSLKEVFVKKTPLHRVGLPLTDVGESVETFELSHSDVEFIHPKAFTDFYRLRNLLLKNNKMQVFSRLMLPFPTSQLELLDLSNNLLTSLPKNVFDGMWKLNSLMLQGNKFRVIEEVYMDKVWKQLFFFNAQDNPLDCCHVSWLGKREKPVHFFGQCFEKKTSSVKELKELQENYSQIC